MLIDWFTVGAQALNFVVLVWLLKRFLYKPILNAVDAREKRIAAELADADMKKLEAANERDAFQHKNEIFDQQRSDLLSKAREEARTERQKLIDDARRAADALSAKRQEALKNEARRLTGELSRRTQQEVFAISRKVLTDLASTDLEERLARVFIQRLRAFEGQSKADFADALKKASAPSLVRSAFELPAEQRMAIQKALDEIFSGNFPLRFETAPDLIGGIELSANGQKVAWSIADYLTSLEKGVGEILNAAEEPEAKADGEPEPRKAGTMSP